MRYEPSSVSPRKSKPPFVRKQKRVRSAIPLGSPLPDRLSVLSGEVHFLVVNARCPAILVPMLLDWSDDVYHRRRRAFLPDKLSEVVDALVTLSHANAAFSRAGAPAFHRGEGALDSEDRGGFYAARCAIGALIRLAPVDDEVRMRLAKQVLARIDDDMRKLEKLIPVA